MGELLDLVDAYERGEIPEREFRNRFLSLFAKRHGLNQKPKRKETYLEPVSINQKVKELEKRIKRLEVAITALNARVFGVAPKLESKRIPKELREKWKDEDARASAYRLGYIG
jgi:hypothetical protein